MKTTLSTRKIFSLGTLALATSLLVSLLVPTAQANTFSLPNAPTSVTSYIGASGVVVRWTPGADVNPGITGYVVSAGPGSCPIVVPAIDPNVQRVVNVADAPANATHEDAEPERPGVQANQPQEQGHQDHQKYQLLSHHQ